MSLQTDLSSPPARDAITVTRTILLVDDDPAFHLLAGTALRDAGFRVAFARRVRDAEVALAAAQPSLLVVDGLLPDGGGLSWVRSLRERGCRVPVILVSAFLGQRASAADVTRLQIVRDLAKPLEPALLVEAARAALAQGPAAPPGSPRTFELPRHLQARFVGALAANMGSIERMVRRLLGDPSNDHLRQDAFNLVHKIAGHAATFGFEEVGATAAKLQDALLRRPPTGLAEPLATWSRLARELRAPDPPSPSPRSLGK